MTRVQHGHGDTGTTRRSLPGDDEMAPVSVLVGRSGRHGSWAQKRQYFYSVPGRVPGTTLNTPSTCWYYNYIPQLGCENAMHRGAKQASGLPPSGLCAGVDVTASPTAASLGCNRSRGGGGWLTVVVRPSRCAAFGFHQETKKQKS